MDRSFGAVLRKRFWSNRIDGGIEVAVLAFSLEGLVYDVGNDPRIQYPDEAKKEEIASILSIPISVKSQIIGVLRIYTAEQRNFSEDENEFIAGLADIGDIAIDNARMHDHLKADHERLIADVHQWFELGAVR